MQRETRRTARAIARGLASTYIPEAQHAKLAELVDTLHELAMGRGIAAVDPQTGDTVDKPAEADAGILSDLADALADASSLLEEVAK